MYLILLIIHAFLLYVLKFNMFHNPQGITIPFGTFEKLYIISKEKWGLKEEYVIYYPYGKTPYDSSLYVDKRHIEFDASNLAKYKKFLKNIEKQKEKEKIEKLKIENAEELEELTKFWTRDIELFSKQAKKEIQNAQTTTEEIIKRILK